MCYSKPDDPPPRPSLANLEGGEDGEHDEQATALVSDDPLRDPSAENIADEHREAGGDAVTRDAAERHAQRRRRGGERDRRDEALYGD